MRLIGLSGFKESGKDTAYGQIRELIHELHEANDLNAHGRVERRAFADNLKIMAALSLGYTGHDHELIAAMNTMKESGSLGSWLNNDDLLDGCTTISGRKYLQNFGQHARNVFGDSFWVDQVVPINSHSRQRVWETMGRKGPNVGLPFLGVVTDVRYPNEAERVRQCGGYIWEVVRPGRESDGHSSETPLPRELVDLTINNDGSVVDLREQLWCLLRRTKMVEV